LLYRIAFEAGIPVPTLSKAGLEQLSRDPLPGNVRELENLLQRAVALSDGDELQLELTARQPLTQDASFLDSGPTPLDDDQTTIPSDLQSHLDRQERDILIQALHETNFNRTAAAARLGLSLRQIRYRIARLRIDTPPNSESSDEAA
jgi:two-component system response regulator PilR (NtrC family)